MLRIKAFLLVERNATRDYLDVAALERTQDLYSEFAGEGGDILLTIVMKLAQPDPYDLTEVDLTEYKGIVAPWNSWRAVAKQCHTLAVGLLKHSSNRKTTARSSQ
jgi:hypothetical protein